MADLTLDLATFRTRFPGLAAVSDDVVEWAFQVSADYISPVNYGWIHDNARLDAMYFMAAHIAFLLNKANLNQIHGIVTSTGQGSENVGFAQPPYGSNALRYWLMKSAYGELALGILLSHAAGGLYVGGSRVQSTVRKYNGRF